MGAPALRWQDADGAQQFAYPRGPAGFHTFMVHLAPDGRLRLIENVLDQAHLARVRPGMSKEQVLRTLGPPDERLSAYFPARDELAWDWRFIEGFASPMRMIVLFDATSGTVRSTMIQPEQSAFRRSADALKVGAGGTAKQQWNARYFRIVRLRTMSRTSDRKELP
jgi:hypothetical protein